MNHLAERIIAAREGGADASGVTDPGDTLTNADLLAAARATAAATVRMASRASPLVVVCTPLCVASMVQLLAAVVGDYSICFLDPGSAAPRRASILAALRPDVIVDADGIRVFAGDDRAPLTIADPGYVAMSSGSTGGGPKGVLSRWSALAAFVGPGAEALELDRSSRWGEVSNPAYDMAMTNLLLALASGASIHLSSALGDQLRPLRFTDRVSATHVRLAPRFIELAAAERRPRASTTLRVWASGGDRLPVAHVNQAFAFGVPVVINTYGTSETIGFASASRLAASADVPCVRGTAPVGHGVVGEWATTLIDGDGDSMLAITSPHLPAGYLFGEAADSPVWQAHDTVLTGDVGERVDGLLYCLGRAGRRVKRHGSFVDLDEIDDILRRQRDLPTFTVITLDGALVSLVEGADEEVAVLRRDVSSVLRPESNPDIIAVRLLPRLHNGKTDHRASAALVESIVASGQSSPRETTHRLGQW